MGPIQSGINQLLGMAGGALAIGKKLYADQMGDDTNETSVPTKADKNVEPKKQSGKSASEVMSDLAAKGQEKVRQNTFFQGLIKEIAEEEKRYGEEQRVLAQFRTSNIRRD